MHYKKQLFQISKITGKFILFFFAALPLNVQAKCTSIQTSFTTSETIICGPGKKDISFVNNSTGTESQACDYSWYLNGVSFDQTKGLTTPVNSTISEIGTYAYMLVATDKNSCKDTSVVMVFVYPSPIANFTVTGNNCGETVVKFKNISSGSGAFTVYSWDFGDGAKSSELNPIHTYTAVKSYFVTLTISNGKGCSNVYKDSITLSAGPKPIIEGRDKDGDTKYCLIEKDSASKDTVDFYNFSTNAQSYRWDFGDGSPLLTTVSTEKIRHVYINFGTYKVTMLAIADGCEKSTTLTVIFNRSVQAALSLQSSELTGCVPHQVIPVNKSLNADTYIWNFGDGSPVATVNNTAPFPHLYLKKGVYVITLKAANSCNSVSINSDTLIVEGTPIAKMNVTPLTGCSPQEIKFSNETIFSENTWQWKLGDGSTWNGQDNPPAKIYKEGKWKIVLIATNNCGSDSVVTTIKINPEVSAPSVKDKTICSGTAIKLEVTATQGIYEWFDSLVSGNHLGTGLTYTTPALNEASTYYVQCRLATCLSERVPVRVNVIPLPDVPVIPGVSVCKGNPVTLKVTVPGKYEWFNTETGGTHLDTTAAFTTPPLIINTKYYIQTTVGACKSKRGEVNVTVLNPPKASFKADTVCFGIPTQFEDLSTEYPTFWSWEFGDGNTNKTGAQSSYTYKNAGSYIAKLTVMNGAGCSDSIFQRVVVNELIKAGITAKSTVCMNELTKVKDNSVVGNELIASSTWDFGDGVAVVNSLNATHIYNKAGTYQLTHHVVSDKGCKSEIKIPLVVAPLPIADFSSLNTCQIQESIFKDQSKGDVINWNWDFGDGQKSMQQHPQHTYALSGYFDVALIAKTDAGCSDTSVRKIFVYPQPRASFTSDTVCWGAITSLTNTSLSVDGSIDQVIWDFDDGTSSNDYDPKHVFITERDLFNVTLTIVTSHGCMDTVTQIVHTNPLPEFNFFPAEKIGCEAFTTVFYDSSTVKNGKIINWLWNFGDGNLTYRRQPVHTYSTAGNYEVSLKVTSSYGCEMFHKLNYPIVVYPSPKAGFTATPDEMSIDWPTVQLMDQSTDGTLWDWDFGDHKTSIERNPFHTYSDTGIFIVTQMVINQYGCTDTTQVPVRINAEPDLFIPNAFSPDNDNLNDTFIPVGRGISTFHMLIFDRWGNKIFESNDFSTGWNGRMNGSGELVKQDVYVYKISVKDVLKKINNYTGSVVVKTQ